MTPAQLEAAITPRTKMILICSPSNPTGSVYTRDELAALVAVIARHPDIIVLADEIYEHINYTGSFTSLASFPEIADRTVVVNGVSKAYAMTGWRIGYCAAPTAIAKACTKLQGQYTSGSLVYSPESRRSRLYRFAGLCRGNASGLRAPS